MKHCTDYTGRRFGADKQIEVLEWIRTPAVYKVYCHTCAQDPELHNGAIYETSAAFLKTGGMPCGCAKHPMWTPKQYQVRIRRSLDGSTVVLHPVDQAVSSRGDFVTVTCSTHVGHVWEVQVGSLLRGTRCRLCYNERTSLRNFIPDEIHVRDFTESGYFAEGSLFWRDREEITKWNYTCGRCSTDEYVINGLCSGVFSSTSTRLKKGNLPCRCSGFQAAWTKEQREYQISQSEKVLSQDYFFIGWAETYKGSWTKINMRCGNPQHGNWQVHLTTYINGKSLCPSCAPYGYSRAKQGYLYVITIEGNGGIRFVGYGISNVPKRRLSTHRRALKKVGLRITSVRIFSVDGDVAKRIESDLIRKYKPYDVDVTGFKRESAEFVMLDSMVRDILSTEGVTEIFEDYLN